MRIIDVYCDSIVYSYSSLHCHFVAVYYCLYLAPRVEGFEVWIVEFTGVRYHCR